MHFLKNYGISRKTLYLFYVLILQVYIVRASNCSSEDEEDDTAVGDCDAKSTSDGAKDPDQNGKAEPKRSTRSKKVVSSSKTARQKKK